VKAVYRHLVFIHVAVFIMLVATWTAGAAIKTEAGTPFVALYYVLHIFPGSIIFILILFEWLARNQGALAEVPRDQLVNRALHRAYYLILLALPITGIAIFFDFMAMRPFYQIHHWLFNLLLTLVFVNIVHMVTVKLIR
jgi:cytochrome b561